MEEMIYRLYQGTTKIVYFLKPVYETLHTYCKRLNDKRL